MVSVSFRSYLFSNNSINCLLDRQLILFPSPFGVICSLINDIDDVEDILYRITFPSPFGVICSLMFGWKIKPVYHKLFPSPFGVICSLIKHIF